MDQLTPSQQQVLEKIRQAREIISMLKAEKVGETVVWYADGEMLPFETTMQLVDLGYLAYSGKGMHAPYAKFWHLTPNKEQ